MKVKTKKIETPKYVTYKELIAIANQLEDYRDKVILFLIFDGYYTKMEEIQNLKTKDIVDTKHQKFIGDHKISDATMRFIRRAIQEKEIHTYSQFNGGIDKLIDSDYIVRERVGYASRVTPSGEDKFNGYAMNKQSIINRFARLKRNYGFSLSLSSIYASGVIHRMKDRVNPYDKNARVDYLALADQKEGVKNGMARLYFKEYIDMLPRLEEEKLRKNRENVELEEE